MATRCPACTAVSIDAFFEAASVPVFCNVLRQDAEQARAIPRGAIRLHACPECGLVFNAAFDPALVEYGTNYENSLHSSEVFQAFADRLARRLVERFGLRREVVLEVGCGRGEFLALLCRLGANEGIGFDQSFDGAALPEAGEGTIRIERAPFPAHATGLRPALTFCRHTLEHVPEPVPFLEAMVAVAGRRHGGGIYVEVPNALYTLRDLGIWDIIYEHCAYYTASSLARLLARVGVHVTALYEDYGGQFLCAEGQVDGATSPAPPDVPGWTSMLETFSRHQRAKVAEWEARLASYAARGERVALWGAGSKGVTFLNIVPGTDEAISVVVDLNQRKHGCYTSGTGHPIRGPEALLRDPPSVVLVMNPLYVTEIRERLARLGLSPVVEVV